ncbi:MAG: hypothetical protein KF733_03210 [Fimbriimonadaceae bacterium]|nr:MAG: hypothetical protein KF733_03210 [Fimbriimonadaceae bacterium]
MPESGGFLTTWTAWVFLVPLALTSLLCLGLLVSNALNRPVADLEEDEELEELPVPRWAVFLGFDVVPWSVQLMALLGSFGIAGLAVLTAQASQSLKNPEPWASLAIALVSAVIVSRGVRAGFLRTELKEKLSGDGEPSSEELDKAA